MSNVPKESKQVELYSREFYLLCGIGGALACGITHTLITPLDVVKCRLQVDHKKYKNLINAFKVSVHEEGYAVLTKGWMPAMFGYSMQGFIRFSAYEFLKHEFTEMVDAETAFHYRVPLYLAAAASAEFTADIFLAPFEAMKVRMQTTPGYTSSMMTAMRLMWVCGGIGNFYRGLPPLWGRQIPYTMVKFSVFERTIEFLYKHIMHKPQAECSKGEQLVVTFAAGYTAGVLCAIASHPADTIVSKLNRNPESTIGDIIRNVGLLGVWSGLVPRILMIGAMAAAQWLIYDSFKVFMDMPRPPLPTDPALKKKKK